MSPVARSGKVVSFPSGFDVRGEEAYEASMTCSLRFGVLLLGISSSVSLGCGSEPPPARWRVLGTVSGQALLSVHVRNASEVYFAGGAMLTGGEALALRYDGRSVERIPGAEGVDTLWWVCSAPGGAVWFVGEEGSSFRLDAASGRLERVPTPVDVTLYGCWARTDTEVWAVGGDARGDGEQDVLLRYDGSGWERVALPESRGVTLFKVWGEPRGDLYVVGERATIWHFDGSEWTRESAGIERGRLLTVHASEGRVWAVGAGGPGGIVLRREASGSWVREELPDLAGDLNGVAVSSQGTVLAVGNRLSGWMLDDGRWEDLSERFFELASPELSTRAPVDLHGAAWSPQGREAFAVGGTLVPVPGQPLEAVVLHYGAEERSWGLPAP